MKILFCHYKTSTRADGLCAEVWYVLSCSNALLYHTVEPNSFGRLYPLLIKNVFMMKRQASNRLIDGLIGICGLMKPN